MGYQIIKQPGDLFAVFSSITDTIIVWDATREEVIDWFADEAAERARKSAEKQIDHVANDEPKRAYYQFAMTWQEALDKDRSHGGDAWKDFEANPDVAQS